MNEGVGSCDRFKLTIPEGHLSRSQAMSDLTGAHASQGSARCRPIGSSLDAGELTDVLAYLRVVKTGAPPPESDWRNGEERLTYPMTSFVEPLPLFLSVCLAATLGARSHSERLLNPEKGPRRSWLRTPAPTRAAITAG